MANEQVTGGKTGLIVATLLALFLAALDSTVMGTILPTLIQSVGHFDLYPWLITGFILASTVMTPVYGKLADLYGYRTTYLVAILIFIAGSIAVPLSGTMYGVIISRIVQGIGAGGIPVMTYIVFASLFPPEKRGKMQGVVSSIWGLAAILGPALGSVIVRFLSWEYVFWMNVPLGLISLIVIMTQLKTNEQRTKQPFDVGGLVLFSVTLTSILLLATSGSMSLSSTLVWGLAIVGAVGLISLIAFERKRGQHTFLDLEFFQKKSLFSAGVLNSLATIALYTTVTYIPLLIQGVHNGSVLSSGLAVMVAALGWVIGATIGGNLLNKLGLRNTTLFGCLLLCGGSVILAVMPQDPNGLIPFLGEIGIGFGLGFIATSTLVGAQIEVSPSKLGSVTATIQLYRNLGSTIGVNVYGAIQVAILTRLNGSEISAMQMDNLNATQSHMLYESIHTGFGYLLIATVLPLFLVWAIPNLSPQSAATDNKAAV